MTDSNKLMAEVNGKKIYQADVYEFIQAMGTNDPRLNSPEAFKQVADELINHELLFEDALENKLDQEEDFVRELDLVKENMLKNYAMQKIFNSVSVSDEEVEDYYQKNKDSLFSSTIYSASHILLDDEIKAMKVKKEIDDGLDFAVAARNYSMDPTGENGGSLGQFPKGVMVKEFQDALDQMKPGEISAPVETQFGYHLIKLDDRKEKDLGFEDQKDQVRQTLLMVKRQEAYLDIVGALAQKADINRYY